MCTVQCTLNSTPEISGYFSFGNFPVKFGHARYCWSESSALQQHEYVRGIHTVSGFDGLLEREERHCALFPTHCDHDTDDA